MLIAQKVANILKLMGYENKGVSEPDDLDGDGMIEFDGWHIQVGECHISVVEEVPGGNFKLHNEVTLVGTTIIGAVIEVVKSIPKQATLLRNLG